MLTGLAQQIFKILILVLFCVERTRPHGRERLQ
jgi:hypothetical protein